MIKVKEKILEISILVLLLFLIFGVFYDINIRLDIKEKLNEKQEGVCETCILYNIEAGQLGITGLYDPNHRFYCVWAKNRSIEQTTKTEVHELCHDLVHQKQKHYCDW